MPVSENTKPNTTMKLDHTLSLLHPHNWALLSEKFEPLKVKFDAWNEHKAKGRFQSAVTAKNEALAFIDGNVAALLEVCANAPKDSTTLRELGQSVRAASHRSKFDDRKWQIFRRDEDTGDWEEFGPVIGNSIAASDRFERLAKANTWDMPDKYDLRRVEEETE